MRSNTAKTARFSLGDRVQIVRIGPNMKLIGIVIEVDTSRLVPHYVIEVNHVMKGRFVEADLAVAPKVN